MKNLAALLVALVSAGWVVPMAFGAQLYFEFWHAEAWQRLLGKAPLNSMDFLAASAGCFRIAFIWLGVVIFGWAFVITRKLLSDRAV